MPKATIELDFADGKYLFALPLPQIREVQNKAGDASGPAPIGAVYQRIVSGARKGADGSIVLQPATAMFFVDDLYAVIFCGLCGGGSGTVDGEPVNVRPQDAKRLMETYVYGRPLVEAWEIAFAVAMACMHGFEPPEEKAKEEPEGNGGAAAENANGQNSSTSEPHSQT